MSANYAMIQLIFQLGWRRVSMSQQAAGQMAIAASTYFSPCATQTRKMCRIKA